MPNGRTSMFLVSMADLQQLVEGLASNIVVGKRLRSIDGQRGWEVVTAEQLLGLAGTQHPQTFFVEEQDHYWFIIHLSQAMEDWISIGQPSAIREGLMKYMVDGRQRWPPDH